MPTNLVQVNSQCYGFIDNTKGKNISQKKTKKQKKTKNIYIYIYTPNCNKVVTEKSKKEKAKS